MEGGGEEGEGGEWLYELLADVQLEQFYTKIRDDLQVTRFTSILFSCVLSMKEYKRTTNIFILSCLRCFEGDLFGHFRN